MTANTTPKSEPIWKYNEGPWLDKARAMIAETYSEHYSADDDSDIQVLDGWAARNLEGTEHTCINTANKYLMRFGKKSGRNRKDLLKAIHYTVLALHFADKVDAKASKKAISKA